MENNFKERGLPVHAGAGKELAERRSQRIRRGAQSHGFAFKERRGVVGGKQTDAQQQKRNHLLCDCARLAWADRHD